LLGSLIKSLDPLAGLACFDRKGRRPPCALFIKDALCLSNGGKGLWITYLNFLEIPCHSIITTPGHHTEHTHNQVLPFKWCSNTLIPAFSTATRHTLSGVWPSPDQ
jgi:hypothetical protein